MEKFSKSEVELLLKIRAEIEALPFGEHPALPWCRESFPKIDRLLKKYKALYGRKL